MSRGSILVIIALVSLNWPMTVAAQDTVPAASTTVPSTPRGWLPLANAPAHFPAAPQGELAVVASGPLVGRVLPVIVHNNMERPATELLIRATARTTEGALVDVGTSTTAGLFPRVVEAGAIAFGEVRFDLLREGDVAVYEFAIGERRPPEDADQHPVDVVLLERVGSRLLGGLVNPFDFTPTRTDIAVMCLSPGLAPVYLVEGDVEDPQPEPGDLAAFVIDLPKGDEARCVAFVGVAEMREP